MKVFKIILGTAFALALIAGCGYLIYMFLGITYLPKTLSIIIMVLCGIGIYATIHIWSMFISSLGRKKHYRDKDNDEDIF